MEQVQKKNNNLVYAIFMALAVCIIAAVAILTGVVYAKKGSDFAGQALMYFILAALILGGGATLVYTQFSFRKDLSLVGILLSHLAIVIFLFIQYNGDQLAVWTGIFFFAYTIVRVIGLYLDKLPISIVQLVLSSVSFLFFVGYGVENLVKLSFSTISVISLFGFLFLAIAIFIDSLFRLLDFVKASKKPYLSEEQIAALKELKAEHDEKKISDEEFESKRAEIVK